MRSGNGPCRGRAGEPSQNWTSIEMAGPAGGATILGYPRRDVTDPVDPAPSVNLSSALRRARAGRFGRLVAASRAMRRLFAVLERAAPSDATVLLIGETGTGKELAAESIHEA